MNLMKWQQCVKVCSSEKAMLQTCFSGRPWRGMCVGDLPIGLNDFFIAVVFFHNILWLPTVSLLSSFSLSLLPHESPFDLLHMNEHFKITVFPASPLSLLEKKKSSLAKSHLVNI